MGVGGFVQLSPEYIIDLIIPAPRTLVLEKDGYQVAKNLC